MSRVWRWEVWAGLYPIVTDALPIAFRHAEEQVSKAMIVRE